MTLLQKPLILPITAAALLALATTAHGQFPCGDCDQAGDGTTILDALVAAQIAAGSITPTPIQSCACDVDNSTTVTSLDALLLQQIAAGFPVTPVCPPNCTLPSCTITGVGPGAPPLSQTVSISLTGSFPAGSTISMSYALAVGGGGPATGTVQGGGALPYTFPTATAAATLDWDSLTDVPGYCSLVTVTVTITTSLGLSSTCSFTFSLQNPYVATMGAALDNCLSPGPGPTGTVPGYAGGGATPCIYAVNPQHAFFWDFEYANVNTGIFNNTIRLVNANGSNNGNPVVLYSAGHNYGLGNCNTVQTFTPQFRLTALDSMTGNGTINGCGSGSSGLFATAACNPPDYNISWMSTNPTVVAANATTGQLTAVAENACTTIIWTVTTTHPNLIIPGGSLSGSFAACVDSGGIDTASRLAFLPVGDLDMNIPGLPSGMPLLPTGAGGTVWFGTTVIAHHVSELNFGAYQVTSAITPFNNLVYLDPPTTIPACWNNVCAGGYMGNVGVGGSTQPGLLCPFVVNTTTTPPGTAVWNDIDPPCTTSIPIFDIGGQTVMQTMLAPGQPVSFALLNNQLADCAGVINRAACLPASGTYTTIAGTAAVPFRLP